MSIFRAPAMVLGGLLQSALTNERLFLMGITSLALSLASGWTTFEGMTNFTRSPVLCFLITFGVQGIMLVSSWMIGETFVSVKTKQQKEAAKSRPFSTAILGTLSFMKIWMIWMVFLFAMAISVFFSFDSLFSSIFSEEERQRAGEIRAQNQVAGVLTDLKKRGEQRKFEAIDDLLTSEGWKDYNQRLDQLSKVARSAPELVEQQLMVKLRSEQSEIARHQETLAQAKGQKAALKNNQLKIEQTTSRLKQDRPGLSSEVEQLRQSLREKQRLIDQSLAEAAKEARGIGATGKEGEGPKFRAIKENQRRLTAERDVLQTQKDLAVSRLEQLDQQIAKSAQELALINGEVAKIEGEASVAQQFIDAQKKRQSENIVADLSATASIDSLDQARDQFLQTTNKPNLLNIQQNCTNLHNALTEVPKIAGEIRTISCEPGASVATIAARIFTLQQAQSLQAENCAIGKGRRATRIDSLLKKGQNCIQKSGLPEADANEFRNILSRIDLNRDDKAKNFVVTLNAFSDGNWLAYLALSLAIAIDSLVFISGLIGAKTASYENTGSPSDVLKYGLGMSTTIYGHEPEDIYTRKMFFRSVSGPSPLEGYLAIIDMKNLRPEEKQFVTKVLTIAGDNIKLDAVNPSAYHIEEKFYQNLARQVYLWDKFNGPKKEKPKKQPLSKAKIEYVQDVAETFDPGQFGKAEKGSITSKGNSRASFSGFASGGFFNRNAEAKAANEPSSNDISTPPSVPLVSQNSNDDKAVDEKSNFWDIVKNIPKSLSSGDKSRSIKVIDGEIVHDAPKTEPANQQMQISSDSHNVNDDQIEFQNEEFISDTPTNDNAKSKTDGE